MLRWKKIRMVIILFGQDEKIIQYNDGVFKSFDINQSESRTNYREIFIFFCDIKQSESSIPSR